MDSVFLGILPIVAGVLIVLANVPALIKLWGMIKTGEPDNQSLNRNYLLLGGNGLLFVYTVAIGNVFLAITSGANTALLLVLITMICASRRV